MRFRAKASVGPAYVLQRSFLTAQTKVLSDARGRLLNQRDNSSRRSSSTTSKNALTKARAIPNVSPLAS